MKTNASSAPRNSNNSENHPPLARDAQGNNVAVPEGTAGWTFKRETRGRPKLIVGPDRRPARFPLDTTADDVEQMLGAGTYRVYAISDVGVTIDYVTTLVVGDDEEDGLGEVGGVPPLALGAGVRGPGSDLRFALETIRDTTRSLADSLKSVAASQAEWVKGLAVAKALPRNAPPWLVTPPPPPAPPVVEEDDDEEEDEAPESGLPGGVPLWLGALAGAIENVSTTVRTVYAARNAAPAPTPDAESNPEPPRNGAGAEKRNPMAHLVKINARLNRVERLYLAQALRGDGADGVSEELLSLDVRDAVTLIQQAVANAESHREEKCEDPAYDVAPVVGNAEAPAAGATDFMAHVAAVSAFLTAEERVAVLGLMPRFPAERVERLKAQLLRMSAADAAAWLRAHLAELRAEVSA